MPVKPEQLLEYARENRVPPDYTIAEGDEALMQGFGKRNRIPLMHAALIKSLLPGKKLHPMTFLLTIVNPFVVARAITMQDSYGYNALMLGACYLPGDVFIRLVSIVLSAPGGSKALVDAQQGKEQVTVLLAIACWQPPAVFASFMHTLLELPDGEKVLLAAMRVFTECGRSVLTYAAAHQTELEGFTRLLQILGRSEEGLEILFRAACLQQTNKWMGIVFRTNYTPLTLAARYQKNGGFNLLVETMASTEAGKALFKGKWPDWLDFAFEEACAKQPRSLVAAVKELQERRLLSEKSCNAWVKKVNPKDYDPAFFAVGIQEKDVDTPPVGLTHDISVDPEPGSKKKGGAPRS